MYQEEMPYIEGEIYTSKSPQSPDSVTRLVQILYTKISFLVLKLKSITIESPGSVTCEYHAHKRIFGADNVFLVDEQ